MKPQIARHTKTLLAIVAFAFVPNAALAQNFDPQGSGPIVSALAWLQSTLLGSIATTAAIIAVAAIGFMMLTGRLNWRFGATVVVGVFVIFGAGSIVTGIQGTVG